VGGTSRACWRVPRGTTGAHGLSRGLRPESPVVHRGVPLPPVRQGQAPWVPLGPPLRSRRCCRHTGGCDPGAQHKAAGENGEALAPIRMRNAPVMAIVVNPKSGRGRAAAILQQIVVPILQVMPPPPTHLELLFGRPIWTPEMPTFIGSLCPWCSLFLVIIPTERVLSDTRPCVRNSSLRVSSSLCWRHNMPATRWSWLPLWTLISAEMVSAC